MQILAFFFLLMTFCCLFYIYFWLGKWCQAKAIWVFLLFEFKISHKAMEITRNISTFGPGTASERTVQWWFKKFCKGDGSLGDEEHCGWPLEGGNNQLRGSPKLIFWQWHKKLPKNSTLTILWKFSIWSKLERWGSSVDGCLMSWPQIKKNHCFEVSSLILCNNNEPFLSQNIDQIVPCYEKWVVYDNQWLAQWLYWEVPKHFSKPNLHQKKVTVSVWWSAAGLIHYSFLNSGKTITSQKYAQQTEIHWKLQCLQLTLVNRKGPVLHSNAWPHIAQPMFQKLNKLGCEVMFHLPYAPDLLTTDYYFKHLNNFLQGKHFHNHQEAENALQGFVKSWSMAFYATGINKYFLLAKMCQFVMVPILTNKDMLEPSYNVLKFTVWNCSYFCTNLIIIWL